MGWSVGWDFNWRRDVGYGVPAICDQPDCGEQINRGLGYVCGNEPYGGEKGCGLFFCGLHQFGPDQQCERCLAGEEPFEPTPDTEEWMWHKLGDSTWSDWRMEHPDEVEFLRNQLFAKRKA